MHIYSLDRWKHSHHFTVSDIENERKTLRVVLLTAGMMGLEIIAGWLTGSMALLADGWHMGTHAAALGITLFAYIFARRQADNPRFAFGTGKMSVLGGFSSAIVLLVVAILMMVESLQRFWNPMDIQFDEAILVAVVGLVVNIVSVYMLGDHYHEHEGDHEHAHPDHNIRAAYLHVLADALTSLLAIIALVVGRFLGWTWLDALMGIVGGVVISRWALGLLRETSHVLLDGSVGEDLLSQIRQIIETDADNRITDLHVWKIGPHHLAAVVTIVTHYPRPIQHYRKLLAALPALSHVTIEVHACREPACMPVGVETMGN
jgi:cation diffusion facilitator family transporter